MPHAVAHSFPPALAALFFSGVRRRKNKRRAPTPTRVPGRETCLSRLNVVNTEFQLRHLIIWSSIFIHATSESGETRAHETGFANTTERRTGVRTCGADGASDGFRLRPVFDPSFSKTRFRGFVSRVNSALVFVAGRKRRDARTVVRRSSEDRNRGDVAAAMIGSIEKKKKASAVGGPRRSSVGCIMSSVSR